MRDTLTYDDMIKSYEDGYITYEECLSLLEYVDDKYAFETSKETKAKRDNQYYMASDNEWKHDFRQQDQKMKLQKILIADDVVCRIQNQYVK